MKITLPAGIPVQDALAKAAEFLENKARDYPYLKAKMTMYITLRDGDLNDCPCNTQDFLIYKDGKVKNLLDEGRERAMRSQLQHLFSEISHKRQQCIWIHRSLEKDKKYLETAEEKMRKPKAIADRKALMESRDKPSIERINDKHFSDEDITKLLDDIHSVIRNNDMGRAFYHWLIHPLDQVRLIDFDNIDNNDFAVVDELTFGKAGTEGEKDGSFRPDINILINGIPLAFLEVKKPNNEGGIQAEFRRMLDRRLEKPEYKKYFNMLQVVSFSNNMEYEDEDDSAMAEDVKAGSFYTTPNGFRTTFSFFREERPKMTGFQDIPMDKVKAVLKDNHYNPSEADSPEFYTNLDPQTPCNRFVTSLFDKERILYFLHYGITYVNGAVPEKHIMRYPQFFASQALVERLENGGKSGIIWHTQGSGKTELAAFSTRILRDYYAKKSITARFYYVVDRLDLLTQVSGEMSKRGLNVVNVNSKGHHFQRSVNSFIRSGGFCPVCNNTIVQTGVNDALTIYSWLDEIWDYSKNEKTPTEITSIANIPVWFTCKKHHHYKVYLITQINHGPGCMVCDNTAVDPNVNSVAAVYPDLSKKWSVHNINTADQVLSTTRTPRLWICSICGGEFLGVPNERSSDEEDCPYCNNKRILPGVNDLVSVNPALAQEYSPDNEIPANQIVATFKKRVKWICPTCHGKYEYPLSEREVGDDSCPYCRNTKILPGFNSFADKHPELLDEWSYPDNILIGVFPEDIMDTWRENVWWICNKHSTPRTYPMSVSRRLLYQKRHMKSCPFCKGLRIKMLH